MMKRIAVVANHEKEHVSEVVAQVRDWGARHGVEVVVAFSDGSDKRPVPQLQFDPERMRELRAEFSGCDLALTLGGDGTLLVAAHAVAPLGIPVLSVNLGSLGFHTQVEPEGLAGALDLVATGEFRTEARLMLEARLERDGDGAPETALALNDLVVAKSAWGRMVHLRVGVDGVPATDVFGDGLVVSTPTGSSAYNYAARGPVLDPGLEAMLINVICPHGMSFSPVVLRPTSRVEVEFHPRKPLEEANVFVDGQPWSAVSHLDRLKISRAPMYLPLIVLADDFYTKLRTKLAWGGLT